MDEPKADPEPAPEDEEREEETSTHPGGWSDTLIDRGLPEVLSGRSSAVAAASHSLVVEMSPPQPQEPLSIM